MTGELSVSEVLSLSGELKYQKRFAEKEEIAINCKHAILVLILDD